MNKYEVITIPNNIDISNPYRYYRLNQSWLSKIDYTSGMTLGVGQWCWDTDEKAYWIKPSITTGGYKEGVISIVDKDIPISAQDDLEIEYMIKTVGNIINANIGVTIAYYDKDMKYLATDSVRDYCFNTNEYVQIKGKIKVNPSLESVKYFAINIGVTNSENTGDYSVKIKNINVNLKRNSAIVPNMRFDYTLNKPIWFNGTNWVDVNGNVV